MLAMLAHFNKMAVKALLRFKLHTVISFLSLGFGFVCFISAVLISNYTDSFDQHFPNADRIYNLVMRNTGELGGPDGFPIVNEPASRYLRAYFPEIPNIVRGSSGGSSEDVTIDGEAHSVAVRYVEDRFFDIFPLETLSGLAPGEALPPNSVMITEVTALRLFGRTDVVGERMLLSNRDDVVIAAVAKTSEYPSHLNSAIALFNSELFIPMDIQERARRQRRIDVGLNPDVDNWGNQSDYVYIEIPEGMDFDQDAFHRQLDEFVKLNIPEERAEFMTYELIPVNELMMATLSFVTGGFSIVNVLIVAGALVLMIGCLNYSNLVIAQLSLRSQEIGVQKILGSKRGLLIIQYCYESFLFVCFALLIVLGVMFGLLTNLQSAGMIGVGPAMLLDSSLWLAITVVVIVTVAIAGGYPALRTATVPLVSMLRPKGSSGYSGRLRATMVGVQFFISGTLMILAMVMFAQNVAMSQQLDGDVADPKIIVITPVSTFSVDPDLLVTQLKQHPGILSVTQVAIRPWDISMSSASLSESSDLNAATIEAATFSVGYEFTETMDVPFIGGRNFSRERSNDRFPNFADLSPTSGPFSVLIDDDLAQAFGHENAMEVIGATLYRHMGPPTIENEMAIELVVIGAIGAQKYQFVDFGSFGVQGNIVYLMPDSANTMIIKISKNNVNDSLQHIDDTWNQLMPNVALKRDFVDNLFYQAYNLFLGISAAIGTLSVFGFLIASIGLLGNATFITNIRRQEVGIRKVMGASSGRLLRMLLLDFAKPILIANVFAWPVGYLIGNTYVSMFAARTEFGAMPFIVSFLLSVLIAVLAVVSQSWKSARVRPAMVLRYE